MFGLDRETVRNLKERFPEGCRVKLDYMNDPWTKLPAGAEGTVRCVDDLGTIHVDWDCGSGLGIAYGEDKCHRIDV